MIDESFVNRWAPQYNSEYDSAIFAEVTPRLRERHAYDRTDLLIVGKWKARGRALGRLDRNSDEDIAYLTAAAFDAPDTIGYRLLTLLSGVGVPMASALLTVWDPDRYTVIDYRALATLRQEAELGATDPDYPTYLRICRDLAARCGCDLRTLDRALWAANRSGTETT